MSHLNQDLVQIQSSHNTKRSLCSAFIIFILTILFEPLNCKDKLLHGFLHSYDQASVCSVNCHLLWMLLLQIFFLRIIREHGTEVILITRSSFSSMVDSTKNSSLKVCQWMFEEMEEKYKKECSHRPIGQFLPNLCCCHPLLHFDQKQS